MERDTDRQKVKEISQVRKSSGKVSEMAGKCMEIWLKLWGKVELEVGEK